MPSHASLPSLTATQVGAQGILANRLANRLKVGSSPSPASANDTASAGTSGAISTCPINPSNATLNFSSITLACRESPCTPALILPLAYLLSAQRGHPLACVRTVKDKRTSHYDILCKWLVHWSLASTWLQLPLPIATAPPYPGPAYT